VLGRNGHGIGVDPFGNNVYTGVRQKAARHNGSNMAILSTVADLTVSNGSTSAETSRPNLAGREAQDRGRPARRPLPY